MATFDAHATLARGTVVTAPAPALTGVSLTVGAGEGAVFPAAPFNCTVYPPDQVPTLANAEVVRVTAVVGDTLTIVRAQENTTAKAIAAGYLVSNSVSVKVFTDIENAINANIQSISAGAGVATSNQIVFSDGNGVSFGAAGNSVITASHDGLTSQSNQAFSAQGGSSAFQTLGFSNTNGISFSNSNGSVVASHDGLTSQSAQAASASNGSFAFQTLNFSNANNVTFGTSAGGIITASVATAAAGNSVNFSAGTTSNNLGSVVFSNSNGVTFGLDAGTITAQHNGLTSQSNQQLTLFATGNTLVSSSGTMNASSLLFAASGNISIGIVGGSVAITGQELGASASNGSFTFHTLNFSNANNVTFGTSAGSIITASVAAAGGGSINFSAGTQSANLASIVFSNSNGVSFGLDNGTITASASGGGGGGGILSEFHSPDMLLGATASLFNGNTSQAMSFLMPQDISFEFVRFAGIFANQEYVRGTIATQSATAWASLAQTFNVVIYSKGTGASSMSMYSVASASAGSTFLNSVSISNTSEGSFTVGITAPYQSGATVFSNAYSLTRTDYWFQSSVVAPRFNGNRFFDVPMATSLSAGNYWMLAGRLQTASTDGHTAFSAITSNLVSCSRAYFGSQVDIAFSEQGTNMATALLFAGSFTTNVSQTTAEFNLSQISRQGSNQKMFFQMMRY